MLKSSAARRSSGQAKSGLSTTGRTTRRTDSNRSNTSWSGTADAGVGLDQSTGGHASCAQNRVEDLLQQLLDLHRNQAAEDDKKERLDRLRERRQNKRHEFANTVASAVGVISALIAAALLAVLLAPPDTVRNHDAWQGHLDEHGNHNMPSACYTDNLQQCHVWQRLYGFSSGIAFICEMVALFLTVAVAMGWTSWLHGALLAFLFGSWFVSLSVVASFWLSSPLVLAIFFSVAMGLFVIASLLLLPSAAMWFFYTLSRAMRQLLFGKGGKNAHSQSRGVSDMVSKADPQQVSPMEWATHTYNRRSRWLPVALYTDAWLRLLAMTEEDIDRPGTTAMPPLLLASSMGNSRAARILLNMGADPDIMCKDGERVVFPLLLAAQGGHWEVATELLLFNADPNLADESGCTPLYIALEKGHTKAVQVLIREGADPGAALLLAAAVGDDWMVEELLLEHGADPNAQDELGRSPLHLGAAGGYAEVVDVLLRGGADQDVLDRGGRSPLHVAAAVGSWQVLALLLAASPDPVQAVSAADLQGRTLLHAAAGAGHRDMVAGMLALGAGHPNKADLHGRVPLHLAAAAGHVDVVEVLLTLRADPSKADDDGCTPLLTLFAPALKHGLPPLNHLKIVELLLKHGADANAANNSGCTSLYFAALLADIKAMELLLEHGANPSAAFHDGSTPLHLAARLGDSRVAAELLGAGADANAADCDGATPLFIAAQQGSTAVAQLLLEAGADPNRCPTSGPAGWTPLHAAAAAGHLAIVRTFKARSSGDLACPGGPADPAKPDGAGVTPWQVAVECGHAEVAVELEDWERELLPAGGEDGGQGKPAIPAASPGLKRHAAGAAPTGGTEAVDSLGAGRLSSRLQQVALQVDPPAVNTLFYRIAVLLRASGGVLPKNTLERQLEGMGYSEDAIWLCTEVAVKRGWILLEEDEAHLLPSMPFCSKLEQEMLRMTDSCALRPEELLDSDASTADDHDTLPPMPSMGWTAAALLAPQRPLATALSAPPAPLAGNIARAGDSNLPSLASAPPEPTVLTNPLFRDTSTPASGATSPTASPNGHAGLRRTTGRGGEPFVPAHLLEPAPATLSRSGKTSPPSPSNGVGSIEIV